MCKLPVYVYKVTGRLIWPASSRAKEGILHALENAENIQNLIYTHACIEVKCGCSNESINDKNILKIYR